MSKPSKKLTPKQKRFCEEYVIDLNASQAALRAGYSKKTHSVIGAQNLLKVIIQAEIQKLKIKIADKAEVSAEYVLTSLVNVAERCQQAEPVMMKDGKGWVETGEYKFDSSGANKALELLGKHLALFTEKVININDLTGEAMKTLAHKFDQLSIDELREIAFGTNTPRKKSIKQSS